MATYSNSKLVDYTRYSPNHSGKKKHAITRITPHCVVGQCSVERLGEIFANTNREASSNYGIGYDGKVGMYVEEKNHSWCSSNWANDDTAITIEVASDTTEPYAMNSTAYAKLVDLCVDICQRYKKTKLLWLGSRTATDAYKQKSNEMVLTVHRWYANKSCPGNWLMSRMGELADTVNARLQGNQQTQKPTNANTNAGKQTAKTKTKQKALGYATHGPLKSLVGTYKITSKNGLNMRHAAGTAAKLMTAIPYGAKVQCYGYYSVVGLTKWLYVVWDDTKTNTEWTGFVCYKYLKK